MCIKNVELLIEIKLDIMVNPVILSIWVSMLSYISKFLTKIACASRLLPLVSLDQTNLKQ